MTKLSDYVVDFLSKLNIKHAFVIQGGAVAHLIDSIGKHSDINYITCQHEQACAMAADAYSRTCNTLGVAIATSGPGATNLITGIANAYYDSIPVIYITGNVTSFRQSDGLGIRQYGFQETDIISIVNSITKYSVKIKKTTDIKYELKKAVFQALDKRKGPVLIDIPDDFQRELINEDELKDFTHTSSSYNKDTFKVNEVQELLEKAKRPLLVFGSGIISAEAIKEAKELSTKFNIPTLYSWPLKGMFNFEDSLNFGSFGTNSPRSGNFIIQNADLIISIGNRLDTHATGSLKDFAREAKIIAIDIDKNELNKFKKFGKEIHIPICIHAKEFINELFKTNYSCKNSDWHNYCKRLKEKYNNSIIKDSNNISPKYFLEHLSNESTNKTIFIGDTGANLVYLFNLIKEKYGQKFISAFNNTPMGFSLPASIAVALVNKDKKIICCCGDGGIQMNIQELATIKYYNLPIIIIVFNNSGHAMIKQTQDDWFDSKYSASSNSDGIPSLNFKEIAISYGIEAVRIDNNSDIKKTVSAIMNKKQLLVELILDESLRIDPMLQFGRPLEDMNPLLQRDEFLENMIIEPTQISKEEL